MRNLDLVKFIAGLHDYIAKAIAPVMLAIGKLREEMQSGFDAEKSEREAVKAQGEAIAKAFDDLRAAQPTDVPTKADVRELISEVVLGAVADPLSSIPSKKYVDDKIEEYVAQADANVATVAELAKQAVANLPKPMGAEEVGSIVAEAMAALPAGFTREDAEKAARDTFIALVESGDILNAKMIGQRIRDTITDQNTMFREAVESIVPKSQEIADQVRALIPDPEPGPPGKTFTLDEVKALVAEAVESAQAKWELAFERRAQDTLQRAIDRMPAPKDGKDGLDLRHFSAKQEKDGRVVLLTLQDDVRTEHIHLEFPVVLDRGFFIRGETKNCEPGDGYTFGGSYWICQEATDDEPSVENKAWRLAVRKGRDARTVKIESDRKTGPVRLNGAE